MKRYIEQINNLKKDEILENYLNLSKQIKNKVDQYLKSKKQLFNEMTQLILIIGYDKKDFSDLTVKYRLDKINTKEGYFEFIALEEGEIELSINIGINIRNKDGVNKLNECCLIEILQKIYELKYFAKE